MNYNNNGQNPYFNNQILRMPYNSNLAAGYPSQNQQINPMTFANQNLLSGYPNQGQQINPMAFSNPNLLSQYPSQTQPISPMAFANPNFVSRYPNQGQQLYGASINQGNQQSMSLEQTIQQNQMMQQDLLDPQQLQQYQQALIYQQQHYNSSNDDDDSSDDEDDKKKVYKFRVGVRKLSCPLIGGSSFAFSEVSHACFLLDKDIFEYGLHEYGKNYSRKKNVGRSYEFDWYSLGDKLKGKTHVSPDKLEQIIIDSQLWTGNQYHMIGGSGSSHNCHDFVQFCIRACAGQNCGMAHKRGPLFLPQNKGALRSAVDWISNFYYE